MFSINTSRNTTREKGELFKLKDNTAKRKNGYKLAMNKMRLKIRRMFQSNREVRLLNNFPVGIMAANGLICPKMDPLINSRKGLSERSRLWQGPGVSPRCPLQPHFPM